MTHEPTQDHELQKALAKFVTVDQAAKETGLPPGRFYFHVERRRVVYVKVGNAVLIPNAEVKRLRAGKDAPLAPAFRASAELRAALKKYADIRTASKQLNLNPSAVRSRIERGKIKTIKVAGRPLIPISEIERVRYERFPGGKPPRGK